VGDTADVVLAGHLRYITQVKNRVVSGNYPYIGELVSQLTVRSIEFPGPRRTPCTRCAPPRRASGAVRGRVTAAAATRIDGRASGRVFFVARPLRA
jgi:hypothetical protein